MPHSSGGGSSSGGFHGGGRGGRSPRFGSGYYKGSRRYVYYIDHRPKYYFSDTPYTREIAKSQQTDAVTLCVTTISLTILVLLVMLSLAFHFFHKVNMNYDTTVIIEDSVDVLTDKEESELKEAFEKFTDLTGVTPAFQSINLIGWRFKYKSLERYAYHQYLKMFDDEKHWLIVFSSNGDRNYWEWEGMIGDYCGSAITQETEAALTSSIQENLQDRSGYTVSEAIIASFEKISRDIDKTSVKVPALLALLLLLPAMIRANAELVREAFFKKYENDPRLSSFRCTTDKEVPVVLQCENCGGWYVDGIHDSCPHCGTQIKPNSGQINCNKSSTE